MRQYGEPASAHRAVVVGDGSGWVEAATRIFAELGVEVVRASEAEAASRLIAQEKPDLLVIRLAASPERSTLALGALRAARLRSPDLRAIAFGDSAERSRIEGAFEAGADAYVLRNAGLDDIAAAIRQVFAPSLYLRYPLVPGEAPRLVPGREPDPQGELEPALTSRERQVLDLIAQGRTNAEAARTLFVTEQTVKFHLSKLYAKLNVANRTQASRWAHARGLVTARVPDRVSH